VSCFDGGTSRGVEGTLYIDTVATNETALDHARRGPLLEKSHDWR
jgi:hypothetical protein